RHTRSKRDWSSDVCSSDLFQILLSKLFIVIIPVYTSGCKAKSANRPKKADFLDPGVQRLDVPVVELGESARVQLVPDALHQVVRSEERRVGTEGRWWWWMK